MVPESFALLREFGLAYVTVDAPHLPVSLEVTAPFAYVRWHGHGSPLWYDYTYSAAEIAEWVPRVRQLTESVATVYGFFNNHFRGDAAANCRTLTEELGLSPPARRGRLDG